MGPRDIETQVIDIVSAYADTTIDADTTLNAGLIDSINFIHIIMDIESRFARGLGPSDISFDHFESCRTLANRVHEIVSARA